MAQAEGTPDTSSIVLYVRREALQISGDVFETRVAPLLAAEDLRQLRRASRRAQRLVDSLLPLKAVWLASVPLSIRAARFSLCHKAVEPYGVRSKDDLVKACIAESCEDMLQACWALGLKKPSLSRWIRYCAEHDLDRLQCLFNYFGFVASDPVVLQVFAVCCAKGLTDTVQWMWAHFHLTRDHIIVANSANGALECRPFVEVCASGHLQLAQWLSEVCQLTADDPISEAFQEACANGCLPVARWLCGELGVTRDIVTARNCYAFREACAHGFVTTADWLCTHFALTRDDALALDRYCFRLGCARGKLNALLWLVDRFGLDRDDALTCNVQALSQSCAAGHLDVVRWLCERFAIERSDVVNCHAVRESKRNGHADISGWLADRYGL
jgi:hypothetical protein